jgi:4-hydroxybenzoate polyprenyltransferase
MLSRQMPLRKLYQYALLMRLHRPIGILLLLWPTLIALWLAGNGQPSAKLVIIFTLGTIVMRSAGCVINDFADRKVDGFVKRTQMRPIVTGQVSPKEAIFLFLFLMVLALLLVIATDLKTLYLSGIAAILAFIYPFTKRYTHYPQIVLGAAFGWAIPMAYSAQMGALPVECWLLYAATLIWAVAYDTLYAMADKEEDMKIGVKSTAIAFGRFDKWIVGLCHLSVLSLFVLLGERLQMGFCYWLGCVVALGLALYQQMLVKDRIPEKSFSAFLNNQWFGFALFAGTYFDLLLIKYFV